ncbi:hypothetical protein CBR_g4031 [Chara braunii]|uniref:Uncharacterized protein n=1 Tax=Chara braunii TaxID=69332 RepID=A0A388KGZ5_CHABU|nr:hypothetical protein CBR_g4031 [Chara braunii]|eukprot:GBG69335.1 hypothetical protein CBR_g4031 [Chara braunii]
MQRRQSVCASDTAVCTCCCGIASRRSAVGNKRKVVELSLRNEAKGNCNGFMMYQKRFRMKGIRGSLIDGQASGHCPVLSGEKKMEVMCKSVYRHGREGWVEDTGWADVAYVKDKEGSYENDSLFSNETVGEGEGRDRGEENAAAAGAAAAAAGGGGGGGEEKEYRRMYVDVEYDGMDEEGNGSESSSGFRNRRGSGERLSSLLFGERGLLFVVSVLVEWARRAAKALSTYLLLYLPPSVPRDGISLAVNGTLILGALWLSKTLFQIAITFALLTFIAVAIVRVIWAARTASAYVFSNGRSRFDGYDEGIKGDGEWTEVNPGTSAGWRSPDGVGGRTTQSFSSGRRRPKGASDGRRMSGFEQMRDRVMQGFQGEFWGGREAEEGENNWTSFGQDAGSKSQFGRRGYGGGDDRDDDDDDEWDFDSTKPGFDSPRRDSEGGQWNDQTTGSFAY